MSHYIFVSESEFGLNPTENVQVRMNTLSYVWSEQTWVFIAGKWMKVILTCAVVYEPSILFSSKKEIGIVCEVKQTLGFSCPERILILWFICSYFVEIPPLFQQCVLFNTIPVKPAVFWNTLLLLLLKYQL